MKEVILSRKNPKIVEASSYKDGKGELFLVEGFHSVEEAIKAKLAIRIFSLKDYQDEIEEYLVTEEIIDKLSSSRNPEGIVALCKKKMASPIKGSRVLLLDRVQDPGNVGTLFRTALAFGFKDIILTPGCASIYNQKTLSSSQGAIFHINVIEKEALKAIEELKKDGYEIYGTSLRNAKSSDSFANDIDKLCLILGNEGSGLKEDILKATDANIFVDIKDIESLNVGIAGGILMHQFRK